MKQRFLENETSIIVFCGLAGSGKSSIISRMLKSNNLKFTSTSFSNLATLRVAKPHLLITNIITSTTAELQSTLTNLISPPNKLKTLILEVTLTSPQQLSHLTLDQEVSWYYTLSPQEITSRPSLPPHVSCVSADVARVKEWQIAAHALRAYHAAPDTFSALSIFDISNLPVLRNSEVFDILTRDLHGISMRTLWFFVKVLRYVVELTIRRIPEIAENFGEFLVIYTKNVGLMIANQIEQVLRMFSGEFDPSQMFAVFPKCASQLQLLECNRTSMPASTCQAHLQRLISECGEYYYKHIDMDSRLKKQEEETVIEALINLIGFEIPESEERGIVGSEKSDSMILSPKFCSLMIQMILKMEAHVPVILWGKDGSGKSALVRCLRSLYAKCQRQCSVISHDPVLQGEKELANLIQLAPNSDLTVVVVKLSRREDVKQILNMVTNRVTSGHICSENVKFVVEFTDPSLKECFDYHDVVSVEVDEIVVKGLLEHLGLPPEVYKLLQPLLIKSSVSYRNVINLAKVYSWIDQVFLNTYQHILIQTDKVSKVPCVLVLTTEICFGKLSDELIDEIAEHYGILSDRDVLLSFTLDYVSKVLFKRSCSSTDVSNTLFLILVSLRTHIPLALSSQIVQPAALQKLLSTNPLLMTHKCTVRVVDKIVSPSEVLQAYWDCLSDCVAVVEENGTARLKNGVIIYEDCVTSVPAATRRIISELVKCKAIRPGTPDLSLIILVPEQTAPPELGSCLLGAGVNLNTIKDLPCLNNEKVCLSSDQEDAKSVSHSNSSSTLNKDITPASRLKKSDEDGPFSLINWIKKSIHLPEDNLQSIASAVLIVKQLLRDSDSSKTSLFERLENILRLWGEILSYICLVPPAVVERTSHLVKVTGTHFISQLIEIRLGDLYCKEIFSWSNAYDFYTEIKLLSSYAEDDDIRAHVQPLLWYSEMSSMFCKVKNANLSQFLAVIRDLKSGRNISFTHFSSWVDHLQDNRVLVYFLILLMKDRNFSLSDLVGVIGGVLEVVDNVKVLCALFRQIFWTYGAGSLDEICDQIKFVQTSSASLSALVCVYQSEVVKNEAPLKTVPDRVNVQSVALVRQTLVYCSDVLVDFYNESCGQEKFIEDIGEYFENRKSSSSFCILTTLISEADNTAIRQFILRQLLEKRGTDCLKYFLSALADLKLDTVDSEDVIDINEVIPGYSTTKIKVVPVCTLCCNDHDNRKLLDKGVASLLYYEFTLQSRTPQCNCLYRSLPSHVTGIFNNSQSLGIHGRIAVYLTSQLSSVNNPFMGYFSYLLTGSDLDNIYWMGMPHDDLFEIINTVKPSEKYAGVEKVYTFYKCPRGHVYSINNCGDPLQREKCPECKEIIGGRDHIAAEQNSKFDPDEKQRIETGYTSRGDEFKPGTTYIRQLSQLSTAVLWYLTHAILPLRNDPYTPSEDPTFEIKQRLEESFAGIMNKLGASPDATTMFMLDVVNKLSTSESDLVYKSEIVHDSLKAQDILIMKKLNDLKSIRSIWEEKFNDVVSKARENSDALKNDMGESEFSEKRSNHHTDETNTLDMDVIGYPCYWFTEDISRIPLSSLRYSDFSNKEGEKNKQLQAFIDRNETLPIIKRLPFLLNMLKDLKESLSYKADYKILLDPASKHLVDSNINLWYETWVELEAIWDKSKLSYSIRDLKPMNELILFDIVPTNYFSSAEAASGIPPNCQSGSVTLDMIKYLSVLQNELVPGQSETTQLEKCRYLHFDPQSLAPFLCDDQTHLTNYVYNRLIMPLSRLQYDRDACLQALSSRVLYCDKNGKDCGNIVKFYRSQQNQLDLECAEHKLLERSEIHDLMYCHRILTGLMTGLGTGEIRHKDFLDTINMKSQVVQLLRDEQKLFSAYRKVNVLSVRSILLNTHSDQDQKINHALGELISCLLSSELYNKPCSVSHLSEQDRESLVSLLAEFVTLKLLNVDPPDYYVGWELGEALEFYLEAFGDRDLNIVELVGEEVKVDSVGYLLNHFVQDQN